VPGERRARRGGSELDGVRPWRRGDSMRQVVWKKVARSGELVSRDTAGSGSARAVAGLGRHAPAPTPSSACRAWRPGCWWPTARPGPTAAAARARAAAGQGDAHRRAALELLALWP
jgi:hypothetical protein